MPVPRFCLLQDIQTGKIPDWIYPQYLLTTLPPHTFPAYSLYLAANLMHPIAICWNMEEQSKQCVLGGGSAEVEADFVSLSKKSQAQYYILYLESNLETLMHLTSRVVAGGGVGSSVHI